MKIFNLFLIIFSISILLNCKKGDVSDDEYEILNILTSQIKYPIPPPPPLKFDNEKDLSDEEKVIIIKDIISKDSIEKSKHNFTLYFRDSLQGLEKDFKNRLFEKKIGFEEFYLKEITTDLTISKKLNLDKLSFPKNITLTKNPGTDFSKWTDNFYGKYWISRIIFNKDKNKAITEFNHICGHFCGGGSIIYFVKIDGRWKIVDISYSWVS